MSKFIGTHYPGLVISREDEALLRAYAAATGQTILGGHNGIMDVNADRAEHAQFVTDNGSQIAAFRSIPAEKRLSEAQYRAARAEVEKARSLIANPTFAPKSSSSSSSAAPVAPKTLATVSKADLERWRVTREDGKIDPKLLEYIRAASQMFENVNITCVTFTGGKSMSLSHRKMLNYLIGMHGLDPAVRMVEEKVWVEDSLSTAAITAIPKGKIEILLPEYCMAIREGEVQAFLWAAYESRCVYRAGMEGLAPAYIGAGSNKERDEGKIVSEEERHRRRVAYARNTCNYLRSLFTSNIFRAVLNEQLVANGEAELTE